MSTEQRISLETLQEGAAIARAAGQEKDADLLQTLADLLRARHRQVFDGLAVVRDPPELHLQVPPKRVR